MMAEKSRRSKKKSKDNSDSSDDDIDAYVNFHVKSAMKEVGKAMKQVKMAEKKGKHAQKCAFEGIPVGDQFGFGKDFKAYGASSCKSEGGGYTQYNKINHKGTMINIKNAQHVQVGNNNLMVVTDAKLPHTRQSSQSRDTAEDDRKKAEDKRKTEEIEMRYKDVLESPRLVVAGDFDRTCPHLTNWRRFLRKLGLFDGEIEQLYQEHHVRGIREVLIQGLLLWKQRAGREATLGAFAEILIQLKQFDAIEKLKV